MVTPSYPVEICPSCSAVVRVYHLDRRMLTHRHPKAGTMCPRSGTVATAKGRRTKIN
jgi:hypothetical protein